MKVADHRDEDQPESTRSSDSQDACAFAIAVARIASLNKTEDVCVLDLRGLSNLADYFVIGTGTSGRQMHAVLEDIEEHARGVGRRPFGRGYSRDSAWLLADYVDVVIHLFDPEHRSFYDLDGLWGDAPRVAWQPVESAPAETACAPDSVT